MLSKWNTLSWPQGDIAAMLWLDRYLHILIIVVLSLKLCKTDRRPRYIVLAYACNLFFWFISDLWEISWLID